MGKTKLKYLYNYISECAYYNKELKKGHNSKFLEGKIAAYEDMKEFIESLLLCGKLKSKKG